MRHLCTVLFSLALIVNISAQSKSSISDLRASNVVNLTFKSLPTAAQAEALAKEGITLLSYKQDNTYTALVGAKTSLDKLTNDFDFEYDLQKSSKSLSLTSDVAADHIPAHANHNNGTVDVAITFTTEFSEDAINTFLNENDARLLQSFSNGQVAIVNVAKDKIENIVSEPFVQHAEFKEADVESLNYQNKILQGAHYVNRNAIPGMELDGSGVVIGVGDGGQLGDHIDFDDMLLSETTEYVERFGAHGDHVTGTIGSKGNLDARHSGFAPGAGLIIERTTNAFFKSREYYDDLGMVLTNNSYGSLFDCEKNGAYNYTSFELDKQLREMPNLMHVFAAGNDGVATCDGYPKGFQTILKYYGAAKNVLTVGSVDEDLVIAGSSARGPAKDGRLKPEIMGVGVNVVSTGRDQNYYINQGTSMAAPSITGSMALMYQKYEQDTGEIARGDLMKAIVCNTADDLGVSGPDYQYGFGIMNTFRAVRTIENENYYLGAVENAQDNDYIIQVEAGATEAKFLLYWNDKEITSNPEKALVNNLDFQIIAPNGDVILPWVLDHTSSKVDQMASRKVDNLNNIEQVTIDNPMPGEYRLVVKGTEVPFGPQEYAVAYEVSEPEVMLMFPAGGESLVPDERYEITWLANKSNENSFKLEVSLDNGMTWDLIVDNIPAEHRNYTWRTPNLTSQCAKIRVLVHNTSLQHEHDAAINILGKPVNFKSIPVCQETIRLAWEENNTADSYLVYMLKDGKMEVVAETDQKFADIEYDYEEGEEYWFSVANKTNLGNIGERVVAISATSRFDFPCDRENDGKIGDIFGIANGREHTATSLDEEAGIGVLVQNNGNNELNDYNVSIRINGAGTLKEKATTNLNRGEEHVYEFDNKFDFAEVGTYAIDTWISHPLDQSHYNDSLVGQFQIKQLPNEPVVFPLAFDFEESEDFYYHKSQIGLGDLTHFDFFNQETSASSVFVGGTGNSRHLVMENNEQTTEDGNSYVVTVNMSEVKEGDKPNVSFDAKLVSQNLIENGAVYLRGSDADQWVKIMNLENTLEWEQYENVDILDYLGEAGQNLSTSTQVKFTFSGEGSFSLDNIVFDNISITAGLSLGEVTNMANVYPNIVQNDFTLDIEGQDIGEAKISIVSGNGQILSEKEENLVSGNNIFNYSELQNQAPGIYFVTIEVGSRREVKKVTKVSK